jgi:hypothetical protein
MFLKASNEIFANVKIRSEKILPHPLFDCRLTSLDNQRTRQIDQEFKKQEKIDRFESAVTSWPFWVYRQYNPYRLAHKIRKQLKFIDNSNIFFTIAFINEMLSHDRCDIFKLIIKLI